MSTDSEWNIHQIPDHEQRASAFLLRAQLLAKYFPQIELEIRVIDIDEWDTIMNLPPHILPDGIEIDEATKNKLRHMHEAETSQQSQVSALVCSESDEEIANFIDKLDYLAQSSGADDYRIKYAVDRTNEPRTEDEEIPSFSVFVNYTFTSDNEGKNKSPGHRA